MSVETNAGPVIHKTGADLVNALTTDATWYVRSEHGYALVFPNDRTDALDRALVTLESYGGHKISARFYLTKARLAQTRAEIDVIVAAAENDKALAKAAKKRMREAADALTRAIDYAVYRGAI